MLLRRYHKEKALEPNPKEDEVKVNAKPKKVKAKE